MLRPSRVRTLIAALLFLSTPAAALAGTGANADLFNARKADGLDAGEGRVHRGGPAGGLADALAAAGVRAFAIAQQMAPRTPISPSDQGESLDDVTDVWPSDTGSNISIGGAGRTHGVDPAHGDALEIATDIVVKLTGRNFEFTRGYTSSLAFDGAGLVGYNWIASPFVFLEEVGAGSPKDLQLATPGMRALTYVYDSGTWYPGGPTAQSIVESSVVIGGNTYATWKLSEPGQWTVDFYRPHDGTGGYTATPSTHEGLIAREQDADGNTWDYTYTVYGTSLSSDKHHARLTAITCSTGDSSPVEEAEIDFTWQDDDSQPEKGRLLNIKVMRDPAGTPVEMQRVEYTYKADGDGLPDALGTANDLIDVRRYTKLDSSSGSVSTWRLQVVQYRYHGGLTNETMSDTDSDGFIESGSAHQLKMTFQPEQVEYFAQQVSSMSIDSVADGADELLTRADGAYWNGGSGSKVVDAAARVIWSYESSGDYRVANQSIQSECGCVSGATQGLALTYDYYGYTPSPFVNGDVTFTTKMTEQYYDSGWQTRRVDYFDSGPGVEDGVPYLLNEAIVDGSDKWVVHREYDSGARTLTKVMSPAVMSSYTAGTSMTAPSYSASGSDGLVYAYEYTADNRLSVVRIGEGDLGSVGSFDKFAEVAYGDGTGSTRKQLPASLKRYRVAGSSSANDVELTSFTYGFHTGGDDVAWIDIQTEAELEAENGPGGNYDAYELFDAAGRNNWSRAEDGALVKRTFQTGTGEFATVTRNASTSGLANPYPSGGGLSTSGWGRNGDGGDLVTTFTRDKMGRIQAVEQPDGATTYAYRTLGAFSQRAGIDYYAELSFPHIINGGAAEYGGPAHASVKNAADRSIGDSDYALGASAITLSSGVVSAYSLSTELTRTVLETDIPGHITKRLSWHDISNSGYYETAYDYDTLGRLVKTTTPTGTITRRTYDVLDRVIEEEMGTDAGSPGDMAATAEYYYDSGGTTTSGVGDGFLTLVRRHVDGSTHRDTIYTCDYRGNHVIVENPIAPHTYSVYDNQDRLVEEAAFCSVPTGIATTLADRGGYTTTAYSQRGLVYRRGLAIDATAGSPSFLEIHTWRDETGRPIEEWRPSTIAVKRTYDGLGRVKTEYMTNRGGDANAGASGTHAAAAALSSDLVYEQTDHRYISGAGHEDLTTTRKRAHDAGNTDYGDLSGLTSADSIISYVGMYYDDAGRLIRRVDFGTNNSNGYEHGGSAPTITQASPPSASGGDLTKLVTETAYNSRGLVDEVTNPRGYVSKTLYDDMNRRIAVIDNYDDAAVSWSSGDGRWTASDLGPDDEDRVVSFVYDGMGHVTKQVAHLPDGGGGEDVQVTQYVYGVDKGAGAQDSDVASDDLLKEIRFPDESTGEAGSTNAYKVRYAYNRQGEMRKMTDQNLDEHDYALDAAGRVTADEVTFDMSSPADQTIDAITTTYDSFGRRQYVRSRNGGSSGTIKNAVKFTYTPLWQVADIWQDYDGDIDEGGGGSNSRKVTYAYTNSAAGAVNTNYSLNNRITYPDGSQVDHNYDKNIKRLSKIERPSGLGATTLVEYSYVGLSKPVVVDYALPDVQLDYQVEHNGDRTSGLYAGFDRFGRPTKQEWADGGLTTHATDGTVPNIPPIVELGYAYDNSGNPTHAYDERPGALQAARDWAYTYDGLDRLTEAARGYHGMSWTYAPGSERWTLDARGNWTQLETDTNGDGDYTDTYELEIRTLNAANELNEQTEYYNPLDLGDLNPPILSDDNTFEDTGAQSTLELLAGGTQTLTHDAWQRLVAVDVDSHQRAEYEYNGIGWRTVKRVDTDQDGSYTFDQRRLMYYDGDGRILEERIDDNFDVDSTVDRICQMMWGDRSSDDLLMRREDANADGDYVDGGDSTWWILTDRQFSVVAVVAANGDLVERVGYTPYGVARHHWATDVDGDGDVDVAGSPTDLSIANAALTKTIDLSGYNVDADMDRDGDVDTADTALISGSGALTYGLVSDPAGPDGDVGYRGTTFDAEDQLYSARGYAYAPTLGRALLRLRSGEFATAQYGIDNSAPTVGQALPGTSSAAFVGPRLGIDPRFSAGRSCLGLSGACRFRTNTDPGGGTGGTGNNTVSIQVDGYPHNVCVDDLEIGPNAPPPGGALPATVTFRGVAYRDGNLVPPSNTAQQFQWNLVRGIVNDPVIPHDLSPEARTRPWYDLDIGNPRPGSDTYEFDLYLGYTFPDGSVPDGPVSCHVKVLPIYRNSAGSPIN